MEIYSMGLNTQYRWYGIGKEQMHHISIFSDPEKRNECHQIGNELFLVIINSIFIQILLFDFNI